MTGGPRVVTFDMASIDGRIGFPDRLLLHGDAGWDAISRRPGVTLPRHGGPPRPPTPGSGAATPSCPPTLPRWTCPPDAPSLFEGFGLGEANAPVRLAPGSVEDQGEGFFFVRYAVGGER